MNEKKDARGRPYVGMRFKCCNAYARIYLDRFGKAFRGYCPKCGRPVNIAVRSGGSKSKFWTAE